jgi:hypothetical protein
MKKYDAPALAGCRVIYQEEQNRYVKALKPIIIAQAAQPPLRRRQLVNRASRLETLRSHVENFSYSALTKRLHESLRCNHP